MADRLRTAVALRRPDAVDWRGRAQRLRFAGEEWGRRFRDRSWLIRAGCAVGAIVLLVTLISVSRPSSSTSGLDFSARGGNPVAPTATPPAALPTTPAPAAVRGPASGVARPTSTAGVRHATPVRTSANPAAPVTSSTPTVVTQQPSSANPTLHVSTTPSHPQTSKASPTSHISKPESNPSTTATVKRPEASSSPPAGAQACLQAGMHCQAGLIYGNAGGTLASAPAISFPAFQALGALGLGQITRMFGAPSSQADLKMLLGAGGFQNLVKSQPAGQSCAYYLASANRTSRAFQLCFNSAYTLVSKAIISTSGAGGGPN